MKTRRVCIPSAAYSTGGWRRRDSRMPRGVRIFKADTAAKQWCTAGEECSVSPPQAEFRLVSWENSEEAECNQVCEAAEVTRPTSYSTIKSCNARLYKKARPK